MYYQTKKAVSSPEYHRVVSQCNGWLGIGHRAPLPTLQRSWCSQFQRFKGVALSPVSARLSCQRRARETPAAAATAAMTANGELSAGGNAPCPLHPPRLQHAFGSVRHTHTSHEPLFLDDMHQFPVTDCLGPIMSGLRRLSCHGHAEMALAFPCWADSLWAGLPFLLLHVAVTCE